MSTELLSRTCDYRAHFSQPVRGSISLVFNSPFLIESFVDKYLSAVATFYLHHSCSNDKHYLLTCLCEDIPTHRPKDLAKGVVKFDDRNTVEEVEI
jgi:hypothetical protein